MSAGEPGTIWDERLQCWIMAPNFVPPPVALSRLSPMGNVLRRLAHLPTLPEYIEQGDRLVGQLMFWCEIPVIGSWIADRLADKLNFVSSKLEREIERAW